MTDQKSFLTENLKKISITITDGQQDQLLRYMNLVLRKNDSLNLTAITDPEEFIRKHLVDSLSLAALPEYQKAEKICDIGTGAGFPGVPLAILSPEKSFYLVDSLAKRLRAVGEMTDEIGVSNILLVHDRAEDAGRGKALRESFDFVTARAVAELRVLAEYCLPLVKIGGCMAAMKGPGVDEERNDAMGAVRILGGKFDRIVPAGPDDLSHNIVVIRKVKKTPGTYPRKAGTPSKHPI